MGRFWKSIRHAGMALVAMSSILFMGCTRDVKDTTSVRLSLPYSKANKVGAMNFENVGVIIINISDNATKRLLRSREWSRHSSCSDPDSCTPPTQFSFDVPKGDRLIQVLIVEEDASGSMQFKYGDATKNLQAADEAVDISLTSAGGATMQGHVYGRYMDAAPSGGPTGFVTGKFNPPDGKPAMTVMRTFMFAGWFNNFMAMDGTARFSYFLNEQVLLPDLHLASPVLNGSSRVLRVKVPDRRREQYQSGGVSSWEPEADERIILGYFGPNSAGQQVCYDGRSGLSLSGIRKPSPDDSDLVWNGGSPSSAEAGPEAGGVSYTPGGAAEPCENTANDYSAQLIFRQDELRNGHDSVGGFRGPFRNFDVGGQQKLYDYSHNSATQTLSVSWQFLPGVTSGPVRVGGVSAFRRIVAGNDEPHDIYGMDGIECAKLSSLGFLSEPGWDMSVAAGATSVTMAIPNVATTNNSQFVLCPFVESDGGRIYPPAGMHIRFDQFGGPMNSLGIRFAGSNTSTSNVDGPSLSGTVPNLLKSAITNNFHNLIVKTNFNHMTAAEITNVEVTTDNGTTWTPVRFFDQTFNGRNVVMLPISASASPANNDDLYLAIMGGGTATDTTFKIRVTVPTTTKNSYGLMNTTYISPPVTVVGTATCASPGILELFDADTMSSVSGSNILSAFSSAGVGSDIDLQLKLRFSGCPSVGAVIDRINTNSVGSTPSGCFDQMDMPLDFSDSFMFHISPSDRMGQDCLVSSYTMYAIMPSNADSENVTMSGSSTTITHSTTPQKLGALVSVDALGTVTNERYLMNLAILGPSAPLTLNAIQLNSDGRLTSSSGLAAGTTTWSLGSNAGAWTGSPAASARFNLGTQSSFAATTSAYLSFDDAGVVGAVPILPINTPGRTVVAVSDQLVDGGTQFMLIDTGSGLELAMLPSNNGNFTGKAMKSFPVPVNSGVTFGAAPTYARVLSFKVDGERFGVFMALRYGSTSKYAYALTSGHGESMTAIWANHVQGTDEYVYGAELEFDGPNPYVLIAHDFPTAPARYLSRSNIPTHNGTSWSGQAMFPQSSAGLPVAPVLGLVRCEGELYVVGRNGSNQLDARRVSGLTTPTLDGASLVGGADISTATRVACVGFGPNPASPGRIFFTYNEANATNSVSGFHDSGNSSCGSGSPNWPLSGTTTLSVTPSVGGIAKAMGARIGASFGFLIAYQVAAYPTKLTFIPFTCSSSVATSGSPQVVGSLAMPAPGIKGISGASWHGGMQSPHSIPEISIYGANHQYYLLRSR